MLILLSPAKSLDFESPLATKKNSQPRLLEETENVLDQMQKMTPDELSSLMHISAGLGELNFRRFQDFTIEHTKKNSRPAILAYHGDVYQGLAADKRFDSRDFTEAQKTLRIISGLYGILRPLDLIQPYRLEMGARVVISDAGDLYEFWADKVNKLLLADLVESPGPEVLINLASKEYSSVVEVAVPMISPRFEEYAPNGRRRMVSFYAKQARGEMAAWMILNRVRRISELSEFEQVGYQYDPVRSTKQVPVFARPIDWHV